MIPTLFGLTGLLVAGTLIRGIRLRLQPDDPDVRRRWKSLITWWVLFLFLTAAVVLGRAGVVLLMTVASLFLLRESLSLVGVPRALPLAAAPAAGLYLWAWLDWPTVFFRVMPVLAGIVLVGELVRRALSGPRLERPAAVGRAFLLSVVGPSFLVAVASLPAAEGQSEATLGWLVLVAVLTELNDSAQAWWGRGLGDHQMAPRLSPHKTWEGLVGGVATTGALAVVLAPLLTPFGRSWLESAALGVLVALAATAGDLLASAEKRRAGVKDAGDLLPGHGGLLDRLDSLAVSAPVFFFVTWWVWF